MSILRTTARRVTRQLAVLAVLPVLPVLLLAGCALPDGTIAPRPAAPAGAALASAPDAVEVSAEATAADPTAADPTAAATTAAQAAASTGPIAAPTAGTWVGVSIDGAPLGRRGNAAWDAWTTNVGKRAAIIMWFADWSSSFQGYAVNDAYARGAMPLITWEMKSGRTAIRYADVLAGRWDKYLNTYAAAVKANGGRIFLRFGHEMNGDWYGWSGAQNGGGAEAPAQFIRTWHYVRARFQAAGATNVTWVWCPNAESIPNESWNAASAYFPGDSAVDWICADGYNWGTSQTVAVNGWNSRWQSFDEVFGPIYQELTALPTTKPMMIGETGSSELGGSKAAWIDTAAMRLPADYPRIRAITWFNYNKETDWRVESSSSSLAAFRSSFAANPYFVWR